MALAEPDAHLCFTDAVLGLQRFFLAGQAPPVNPKQLHQAYQNTKYNPTGLAHLLSMHGLRATVFKPFYAHPTHMLQSTFSPLATVIAKQIQKGDSSAPYGLLVNGILPFSTGAFDGHFFVIRYKPPVYLLQNSPAQLNTFTTCRSVEMLQKKIQIGRAHV